MGAHTHAHTHRCRVRLCVVLLFSDGLLSLFLIIHDIKLWSTKLDPVSSLFIQAHTNTDMHTHVSMLVWQKYTNGPVMFIEEGPIIYQ